MQIIAANPESLSLLTFMYLNESYSYNDFNDSFMLPHIPQ
jgi:hypothetical protein